MKNQAKAAFEVLRENLLVIAGGLGLYIAVTDSNFVTVKTYAQALSIVVLLAGLLPMVRAYITVKWPAKEKKSYEISTKAK